MGKVHWQDDEHGSGELPEYDEIMCHRCKRFFPFEQMRICKRNGRKLCERCTDSQKPHEHTDPWL